MKKSPNYALLLPLVLLIAITSCNKGGEQITANDPVINSVYPAAAKGGDTVTAHGKNLPTDVSSVRISVNNKTARIISATPDSIQAVVPVMAGTGKVILEVGSETFEGPVVEYKYEVIVTTIAGDGFAGAADGPGVHASFNCPWGIAADANDNLFIADCYNRLIRKINGTDSTVSTFPIPTLVNGANFYSPYNLAIDHHTNNVYVTDFNEHLMRMTSAGTMDVIYVDSMPLAGIAVSPDGNNLYVDNNTTGEIKKLNIDGSGATRVAAIPTPRNILFNSKGKMFVAGYPAAVYEIAADGSANSAVPEVPDYQGWEFTTDTSGNFYLADHFNNCIRMMDKNGTVFRIAGNGDPVDKDGVGLDASFNGPQGITIDSRGVLYVTTYNYDTKEGNKVRKIVIK
jgi:DNA-binding beta-propeller fold protein YncE